jgi:hypothetical protein
MARQHKAERDSWIEMGAAQVSSGIDHCRDNEAADQPNADIGYLPAGDVIDHNPLTSYENDSVCADPLCNTGREQWYLR